MAWHLRHEYLFGSVGDDQYLHMWDLRSPSVNKPIQSVVAHQGEVGVISISTSVMPQCFKLLIDMRTILLCWDAHFILWHVYWPSMSKCNLNRWTVWRSILSMNGFWQRVPLTRLSSYSTCERLLLRYTRLIVTSKQFKSIIMVDKIFRLLECAAVSMQGGSFPGWMEPEKRDHLSFVLSW